MLESTPKFKYLLVSVMVSSKDDHNVGLLVIIDPLKLESRIVRPDSKGSVQLGFDKALVA